MTDDIATAAALLAVLGVIAAAVLIARRIAEATSTVDAIAEVDEATDRRCQCGRTLWARGHAAAGVWHDDNLCQPERERIA